MNERRLKMDNETREEFEKVNNTLVDIKLSIEGNNKLQEGLDLPNRMVTAERDIEKKASWNGLYLAVGLIISLVALGIVIAKGVK